MQNLQNGNDADDDTEDKALTDNEESVQMTRSISSQNRRSGTPSALRQTRRQSRDIVSWSAF
jgi:hypothetical protein